MHDITGDMQIDLNEFEVMMLDITQNDESIDIQDNI